MRKELAEVVTMVNLVNLVNFEGASAELELRLADAQRLDAMVKR
jgi:hypothetical protein